MTNRANIVVYSSNKQRDDLVLANYKEIDPLLIKLLSLCTPSGEEKHIVNVIKNQPYVFKNSKKYILDKVQGNLIVQVGQEAPTTMFSSHMDIIGSNGKHATDAGTVETIFLMTHKDAETDVSKFGIVWGAKRFTNKDTNERRYEPSTLGADDKVGVFIMLKMIEAKIPGLYVFHTGEEVGAKGSSHLANKCKEYFEGIQRAIAFDRANYGDVITFQRGQRCASKEFGEELARELNNGMPPKQRFKSEVRGTFTDTASYMDFIPECSNISVGYFNQHGSDEHLDVYWLENWLLPAILKVSWDKLPIKRDPKVRDFGYSQNNYSNYPAWGDEHKRKTWEECDDNTYPYDMPLWTPKDGHLPVIKDTIVKKAIYQFLTMHCYGEKKQEMVDWIYAGFEMQDLFVNELEAKNQEIAQLRAKLGIVVVDEEIATKKGFLRGLILIASQLQAFGNYKTMLEGYVKGAQAWLEKNETKTELRQYKEKELKKLNRLIYAMSCLIDLVCPNEEGQILLNKIEQYVTDHPEQEGWELTDAQLKLQNESPPTETIH